MTKNEKIAASRAATKERMRSQTITVDENWRILRSDPLNWEIQYKGNFKGYFGTVSAALAAIPAKMLNEEARGSLSDVLRSTEAIYAVIDKAIP